MIIIWSPEAADDFETAVEFLAEHNPNAAAKLASGVLQLVELWRKNRWKDPNTF